MNSRLDLSDLEKLLDEEKSITSDTIEKAMEFIKTYSETSNPETNKKFSKFKTKLARQILRTQKELSAGNALRELLEKYNVNISDIFPSFRDYQIDRKNVSSILNAPLLGEGCHSIVYLGQYNNKEIAIKSLSFNEDDYLYSFQRYYIHEIDKLIYLHQAENIIQIHGFFINHELNPPIYCIALEYFSRGSLKDVINNYPELISNSDVRDKIIRCIVIGLKSIHDAKLVHADLKSANILIGENFQAKIADLNDTIGIKEKKIRGSYVYKSPDVLAKKCNTTNDDIFSLGVVIAEIVNLSMISASYPEHIFFFGDKYRNQFLLHYLENGYRAFISEDKSSFKYEMLISHCWEQLRDDRPSITNILSLLMFPESIVFHRLKDFLHGMLAIVCKYGELDHAKDLLNNDEEQSINQIYHDGSTPLMAACASSRTQTNPDLFELLLKNAADIFLKHTINGKTAIDIAFQHNHEIAIKALLFQLHACWTSMHKFDKPAMNLETLKLAKEWVKKNSLEEQYTEAFFTEVEKVIQDKIESNTKIISNTKNEQELLEVIDEFDFIPNSHCETDFEGLIAKSTVFRFFQGKPNRIPEGYGLREQAEKLLNQSIAARFA